MNLASVVQRLNSAKPLSKIPIKRIVQLVSPVFIRWIVIYPVDSAIFLRYHPWLIWPRWICAADLGW